MLLPFILFPLLVGWALKDGEMYFKEAGLWSIPWALSLAFLLVFPGRGLYAVPVVVLIDVVLLVKLIGNPSIG